MKRLYNLSIRKKFAVVIIPLLITILCFDYLQIRDSYLDYSDAVRLNKAIVLGIEINHVVHELQKERSISSGYLANMGGDFLIPLTDQRDRTDSTLRQFYKEIENPELVDLMGAHGSDLEFLQSHFDQIDQLRDQIDHFNFTPDEAISEYSSINTSALNVVSDLINDTRDKEVAQQVHAVIYFLKSKEYASIERAVGTQAFSSDQMDFDMYNRFTSLVATQNTFLDAFRTIASEEFEEIYGLRVQGPHIDEVDRLRKLLFENQELEEDPNYWYKVYTSKINLLKKVEDFMSESIHQRTETIASLVNRSFWTFLALDILIGILAFWLMSTVVTNLLDNVKILESFTKKISTGDYSSKVEIDTKDEIGQYARTFNVMVEEIKVSHAELKKEKDQAQYLYENTYKQSEVVFENVQQGIFLLDKDFKISKLYSKAMETIFDNQKIGGENFANFMRPLIIPRDLEALEMFMRHLFNTDMDEEVVNQLNPIDQVKIFTDTGGLVSTKHIKVSFTRIEQEGIIQNVMVTVSDETKAVLLQQHLEEAEEKKRQETEQVLSILKIDPSVMRGFLFNSKKALTNISERYEANEGDNFNELLDFTFEVIHNLKGNASVIGLELMSDKFHELEESIRKLQDQKVVKSKDFLSILYEVDDVDKMMNEMGDMLRKVASIYRKLPAEGQVVSNIMVINTLQKGVETVSKEVGKPVEFLFHNDRNGVIPETYIAPIKDIAIQLIRNSIVHGIEEGNMRIAKNKPLKGRIEMELDITEDNELLISYQDDGEGLNIEKIKKKALNRNLITEFEAENMSDDKVADLIFLKGFSTTEKADKHSGRGQGMNLVKRIIEEHKGLFTIKNSQRHFEMTIKFPPVGEAEENEKVA